jgi:hypothetical protein
VEDINQSQEGKRKYISSQEGKEKGGEYSKLT